MPMAYVLQDVPRRSDGHTSRSWGGERERPTTRNLSADGETVLPLCGSGDDASDPEDPVNSREAAEVTAR